MTSVFGRRHPRRGMRNLLALTTPTVDRAVRHGVYADMREVEPDDRKPITDCSMEERVGTRSPTLGHVASGQPRLAGNANKKRPRWYGASWASRLCVGKPTLG